MAEHATTDLHYGFLGDVVYHADETTWTCQRLPVHYAPLEITHEVFCINENGSASNATEPPPRKQGTQRKEARHLAETYPQLAGVEVLLQRLAKAEVRHLAVASDDARNARLGSLLAFGSSYGFRSATSYPAAIVAYAQGHDRNQLCIAQMRSFRYSIEDDTSDVTLSLARPVPSVAPTWTCPTGRLLQVEFSDAQEERYTLLAVRSPTTIYVFRPLLTTHTAKGSASWKSDQAHTVDANLLLHINTVTILGSTCTDLAFNMRYQWQLVAIDDYGHFAVVEMSKKQKASGSRVFNVVARAQVEEMIDDVEAKHPRSYRVLWLHNVHVFLTVGQRRCAAYDVRNVSVHLTSVDLHEDIVDVAICPSRDNAIFVLTTGHIHWVRIVGLESSSATTEIMSSWRHYFDPLGADLKLAFRGGTADSLIVYSRETFLMSEYPLGDVEGGANVSWLVSNPSSIQRNECLARDSLERIHGFHVVQVHASEEHDRTDDFYDFFQLFVLGKDLRLTGYSCKAISRKDDHEADTTIQRHAKFNRWKARVRTTMEDDWLVSDDDSNASGLDDVVIRLEEFHSLSSSMHQDGAKQSGRKGVSYKLIYDAITNLAGREPADLMIGVNELLADMPHAGQRIVFPDESNTPSTIRDWDASEARLKTLLSQRPSHVKRSPAWPSSLFNVETLSEGREDETLLSALYDKIVATWIGSLPSHVPARTRVRLERLARCMTASIWLSTHRMENEPVAGTVAVDSSQGPTFNASQSQLSSTDVVPTSSQILLPSSQPLPEPISFHGMHLTDAVDAAAQRLARYTTFTKPPQSTPVIDPILSHWTIGNDPAEYDFRAETARLSGTLNVAGSQMSAEAYARQKRRAAMQEERRQQRLQKRLRTSIGGSSVAGSSQPYSQPGRGSDRLWQSSQLQSSALQGLSQSSQYSGLDRQTPQEMQTASQEQPGRHGSRLQPGTLAMRIKGKRKAGF